MSFQSYYHMAQYLAIAATGYVLLALAVTVRRVYFHPYSNVPGPLLAKMSSIYSGYHSWKGTMHLDIQRCHLKYGCVIRYSPNQILTLYPDDMATIYGHSAPFRKSKGYETMIPLADGWSAMTSIDKSLHHRLRKVFKIGVTSESLARYEPAITRNLEVYFDEIQKERDAEGWSVARDMREWNLCLGFDTMADFGLGLKTDLLRTSDRKFVLPALHAHEKKMGLWEQLPYLNDVGISHLAAYALLLVSARSRRFARWFQSFLDQAITNNVPESRGIFGPVIQSGHGILNVPGHNQAQMIGEGAFSTFSSADAYGIMVSGFVHYLCNYPYVYEKLSKELRRDHVPGEKIIWDAKLESNTYLHAVINEVMRLLPPACGVHWRECERPGIFIGPSRQPVSVGSDVGISLFSLFRDGAVFRDPVRFWPERWIQGTLPEEEHRLAKTMFTPFLIGPRNCAGSHVAVRMTSIAYAYILVNYDFRLGPNQPTRHHHLRFKATELELRFESHYSIAGWKEGPFVQFRER
ncbi:benzoate 4-monooxygenase cytochrome P450 [Hypoxylon sp. NC1633]|nr:benzoate 4-monooxygenase cytochrome P450 [Hypoxylon sp. NC1633]